MIDPSLEKCPWCNGTDCRYEQEPFDGDEKRWYIQCHECSSTGPWYPTKEIAAIAWNELSGASSALDLLTEQTIQLENQAEKWEGSGAIPLVNARGALLGILGQEES